MVESFDDALKGIQLARRTLMVPLSVDWEHVLSHRPGSKGLASQRAHELVAAHAHVARPRRHGSCLAAEAAAEQRWIVAADSVHDLGDLIECHRPWAAEVIEPGLPPR